MSQHETGAGSVLDLDYVGGFYAELAPVRLNFIAALNGVQGPDLNSAFNYCELGCGLGETTTLLAASMPGGRFWGIDLSEAHIDRARQLAEAGGVDNVQFLAANVAELDPAALPHLDFITMHGLYAWVPEHVRSAIDSFIGHTLKPGGLVHVSYNAQPGAHNLATLRRYYLERAERMPGGLLERASAITDELESLRQAGAPLFRENPTAEKLFEIIRTNDRRYLVHEMFAEGWRPLAFSEMHGRMAAAGLEFVGDCEVLENFIEHCTLQDFTGRIAALSTRIEQESLKDLIHNRTFRRDVYRRPRPGRHPGEAEPLRSTLLCTTQSLAPAASRVKVTGGTIDLAGAWFDRVKELLALRVLTLREILEDSVLSGCPQEDLLNGLKLATIDGAIGPAAKREEPIPEHIPEQLVVKPSLNQSLLRRFDFNANHLVLASPVTGQGVTVSRMEALLLASLEQSAAAAWIRSRMRECGMSLKKSGSTSQVAEGADESAAVAEIVSAFRQIRLPKLIALGVVGPG